MKEIMNHLLPVNQPSIPVSVLLAPLALMLFLAGCATQPKSEAVEVRSDAFMQFMAREAPKKLCSNAESPFRRCFSLSAEKCTSEVNSVMPDCIRKVMAEMPPVLTSREQGRTYGEKLGRCVGYKFVASSPAYLELAQSCKF